MDEEHCVIAVPLRICEIRYAADKRRYNVFLICLPSPAEQAPPAVPVALDRPPRTGNDAAKIQLFPDMERKYFVSIKIIRIFAIRKLT